MDSRKKLTHSRFRFRIPACFRQPVVKALQGKGKMGSKPGRLFFIFRLINSTCAVNQPPAGFNIHGSIGQDTPLQCRNLLQALRRHPVFDIRFSADNS